MTKAIGKFLYHIFLVLLIILILECVLRIYNLTGKNYDIEMWKYGKYLKRRSRNVEIGIEHIPSRKHKLQNVLVEINSAGFRDKEYVIRKPDNVYRIVVLGSSIALGWGVEEEETYLALTEKWLNAERSNYTIEVINMAVGNYNTLREVEAFFEKGLFFQPDMVILSFFINDPQIITVKENFILKHSQLAVMLWAKYQVITRILRINDSYADYYIKLYSKENNGWDKCQHAMEKLSAYCKNNNIFLLLTMMPEIHNLKKYPFRSIHEIIKEKAAKFGFYFLDFYDVLTDMDAKELWAMSGDPHPNKKGHDIIARYLYKYLVENKPWEEAR